MPRNYKRELEWARSKYSQLMFKISIDEANKHRNHLESHGLKPVDWIRYAISLNLVPPDKMKDSAVCGDNVVTDISDVSLVESDTAKVRKSKPYMPSPSEEMIREWCRLRADGLSYIQIAKLSGGYDPSSIRKRVKKFESASCAEVV